MTASTAPSSELAGQASTKEETRLMVDLPISEDDKMWLSRWTVGRDRKPGMEWLAGNPPPDTVRRMLISFLDRYGTETVFARVMAAHLDVDPVRLYAENWPRKAAKLAAEARARGDHPHADRLHAELISLMFCAKCGRPLEDPVSVERGIGPDCWGRLDPEWRRAISARISGTAPGSRMAAR
jgi:hypothetical protein